MLMRVLHFIIGAALAGGGGWLAWTSRETASGIFPVGQAGLPLMFLAGVFGVTSGIVFLVSAVHPRPNQKRIAAEKAARDDAALQQAEAYYSERSRAADRDWRASEITPPPPAPPAAAVASPAAPAPAAAQPSQPVAPPAAPPPIRPTPPPAPSQPVAKPVAAVFPSDATLAAIPRAQDAPPAAAARPATAAVPVTPAGGEANAAIREALTAGRLDEAEKLLNAGRDTATGIALAELTALAGDHAAASGRQSHARWLWRLALKRFGEQEAMGSPAARAVAESLRVSG